MSVAQLSPEAKETYAKAFAGGVQYAFSHQRGSVDRAFYLKKSVRKIWWINKSLLFL